jgi:hypothetical protein
MIALAAALRLQRDGRPPRKRAAFGVRPRWELETLA